MEVLEHENEGLNLTLAKQQALDRLEGELAALRRLQIPETILLRQGVKKPENRGKQVIERFVECQQVPGGLGANRSYIVALVDTEKSFQKIDDRKIAGSPARGSGAGLEDPTADGTVGVDQLVKQS